jgi:hypothetical protein
MPSIPIVGGPMDKKILYRCPQCDSVLERSPEIDKQMRLIPEKARYICASCGHFMSVTEVSSGHYDIKQPELEVSATSYTQLPDLKGILAKLKREHVDGYVYRGQTKEWPGPLLPSIYRDLIDRHPLPEWHPTMRLREIGSVFHEILSTPLTDYSPKKRAQIIIVKHLRDLFGYPLSQLLAQQCGLTSEGLDVTSDLDVAAFFATFDFASSRFVDSAGIGVIYRFRATQQTYGVTEFKKYDLYNCPTYLNPDVLKLFTPCDSLEESFNSFCDYWVKYMMNSSSNPDRPLEILKIPFHDLERSRVVQQHAGLLIPDMILSKFYASLDRAAPAGKAEKIGMNAIEDLAARDGTEKFLFRHSQDSKRYINAHVQRMFPKEDAFKTMLITFLDRRIFGTPELGILTVDRSEDFLE